MASKKPPQPPAGGPPARPGPAEGTKPPVAYQVLARKYRPATFEDLAGQEAMVRTLANAFRTGRIAHAFMLTGVRGVGKTTTARLLARALNYETDAVNAPSMQLDPPGRHCPDIMASRHPDVLELDAASHTGVSDMRELLDGSRYAPVSARFKVYIIDEVHMLSTAAFNALLKTLEEPPPHVKFVFATTEIRKVPVTVLSRCQRFNLQRFSTEALSAHLAGICRQEGAAADAEALALIARAAEGSARDALSILDQAIVQGEGGAVRADAVRDMLGLADRTRTLEMMASAVGGDHRAALLEAEALLAAGADAAVLVKDLLETMTEVARAQTLKEGYSLAGPSDWADRIRAMAGKLSPAQCARMWRLLLQGFEDCQRAPDPPAAAQMVVLRLAAAASLPPPEEAARMLQQGRLAPEGGGQVARAPVDAGSIAPPRLNSLREIVGELDARRQIDLKYDVEKYVRPAEIAWGRFHFASAPGAPADLALRIKTWLEDTTDVEWDVALTEAVAVRESAAEARARLKRERLHAAQAHPRIVEAMQAFPGARILAVDAPETDEEYDEATTGANVIQVDFGARRRSEEPIPDPIEAEEDDD
jgi:DNA polymerase III subunit gamma/tau